MRQIRRAIGATVVNPALLTAADGHDYRRYAAADISANGHRRGGNARSDAVLPGLVSLSEAQAVADAVARGELTFTQFVEEIVEQAQPTIVPSLIVSDLLGGAAPTQRHHGGSA